MKLCNNMEKVHPEDNSKIKPVIYQLFPRIFTNVSANCVPWGTLAQNGSGKLNDITTPVIDSLGELGINMLWFTGVIEHATCTAYPEHGIPADNMNIVKGIAGSPYAIKDYYDVDPALATDVANRMVEFEECVKRIHDSGLKVIIDFVPNHTARVYHSDSAPAGVEDFGRSDRNDYFFAPDNNYYYFPHQRFCPDFPLDTAPDADPYVEFPSKATGNDCFSAFCSRNDWYETVKLNYGHDYGDNSDHFDPLPDTWKKMLDILLFWASKGVDGFRCDMVFMVPLPFWHWIIPCVKEKYPDIIFIGEIYDVGQYRPFLDYGCFDYLYDKVNLYDTLVGIERSGWSAARLTDCWQTVDGIGDRMLNFLENHDEVRFGSSEYAGDPNNVIPSLVISALISTGPIMIYYGQELGERGTDNEGFAGDNHRSTIFDYWSYDKLRRWYNNGYPSLMNLTDEEQKLRNLYKTVLTLCNSSKAVSEGGFFDLMYVNLNNPGIDPHSQFCFFRYFQDEVLLIVVNFADRDVCLEVNIPEHALKCINLQSGEYESVDLLSGDKTFLELIPDEVTAMTVKRKNARIWRIQNR